MKSNAHALTGARIFAAVLATILVFSAAGKASAVNVTIDAVNISPNVLIAGNEVVGGNSAVLNIAPGIYNVQIGPGGFPGAVTIDSFGVVTYALSLDGPVYTGHGSNTLSITGHPVTLDATDTSGTAFVFGLSDPFPAQTITYSLPVGTYRPFASRLVWARMGS